jgi:hypothetical protein
VTRRQVVTFALLLMLTGLVVAAVGVHLAFGLPAGLVAYGAASVLTGVAVVVLWA